MDPKDEKEDDIILVDEPESGELDSTKEDEKEKKAPKVVKKRGNDSQKRINELWMQRKEAEEAAKHQTARADAEKARSQEYEKITAAALEENLNNKRELLTERLVRAQETGDTKKSAEITAELSKVEAQAAQIERYKIENQVNGAAKPQQAQQAQQVQENTSPPTFDDMYEAQNKFGKDWMDRNRDWYDSSSDAFDEDKASDITLYARSLEAAFHKNGAGFPPGSKGYFRQIDDYMNQNWSDDGADDVEVTPQQKKSYAAPVGNRSVSPQQNNVRKEYKISQSEKEFALALNTKGKDGRPLSDDDKIKRFVSLREGTPESGPISMRTIKG